MPIKFKNDRVKSEFQSSHIGTKLKTLVQEAAKWADEIGEDLVLTCVLRTAAENASLGATSQTHIEGRAVDARVFKSAGSNRDFVAYMNRTFSTGIPNMPRVPNPNHGSAPHFHIQVTRGEAKL